MYIPPDKGITGVQLTKSDGRVSPATIQPHLHRKPSYNIQPELPISHRRAHLPNDVAMPGSCGRLKALVEAHPLGILDSAILSRVHLSAHGLWVQAVANQQHQHLLCCQARPLQPREAEQAIFCAQALNSLPRSTVSPIGHASLSAAGHISTVISCTSTRGHAFSFLPTSMGDTWVAGRDSAAGSIVMTLVRAHFGCLKGHLKGNLLARQQSSSC